MPVTVEITLSQDVVDKHRPDPRFIIAQPGVSVELTLKIDPPPLDPPVLFYSMGSYYCIYCQKSLIFYRAGDNDRFPDCRECGRRL